MNRDLIDRIEALDAKGEGRIRPLSAILDAVEGTDDSQQERKASKSQADVEVSLEWSNFGQFSNAE